MNIKELYNEVLNQFEHYETEYGEPQAFIDLPKERNLEITFEMEGLEEKDYFYSFRVNCSDEEFDNDMFHSTCGVIDTYSTDKEHFNLKEFEEIYDWALRVCKHY